MPNTKEKPSRKPSLSEFFKVILTDWLSGMSGGLSVPFTFLGLFNVWSQKNLFYLLAILALCITTWRLWSKERSRVVELEEQKGKTRFDLFLEFLDRKANQDIILDDNCLTRDNMIEWYNKLEIGLNLFFGGKEIDGVIRLIFQDINSRIMGLKMYPNKDEAEVKRIVAKCQNFVREMRNKVNPTMMSKDFEPLDLDK